MTIDPALVTAIQRVVVDDVAGRRVDAAAVVDLILSDENLSSRHTMPVLVAFFEGAHRSLIGPPRSLDEAERAIASAGAKLSDDTGLALDAAMHAAAAILVAVGGTTLERAQSALASASGATRRDAQLQTPIEAASARFQEVVFEAISSLEARIGQIVASAVGELGADTALNASWTFSAERSMNAPSREFSDVPQQPAQVAAENKRRRQAGLRRRADETIKALDFLADWLNLPDGPGGTGTDHAVVGTETDKVATYLRCAQGALDEWREASERFVGDLRAFMRAAVEASPTRWGVVVGLLREARVSGALLGDECDEYLTRFATKRDAFVGEGERLLPADGEAPVRRFASKADVAEMLRRASALVGKLRPASDAVGDSHDGAGHAREVLARLERHVEAIAEVAARQRTYQDAFRVATSARQQAEVLDRAIEEGIQFYDAPDQSPEALRAAIDPEVREAFALGFDPHEAKARDWVARALGFDPHEAKARDWVARKIQGALAPRPLDPDNPEGPTERFDRAIQVLESVEAGVDEAYGQAVEAARRSLADETQRAQDVAAIEAIGGATRKITAAARGISFDEWKQQRDAIRRFVVGSPHLAWHPTIAEARMSLFDVGNKRAPEWMRDRQARGDSEEAVTWFADVLGSLQALALVTGDPTGSQARIERIRAEWTQSQAPRDQSVNAYVKLSEEIIGAKTYREASNRMSSAAVEGLQKALREHDADEVSADLARQIASFREVSEAGITRSFGRRVAAALTTDGRVREFYQALIQADERMDRAPRDRLNAAAKGYAEYYTETRKHDGAKLWIVRFAQRRATA